jgi:polyribonucleotide nucleotidyltransferase
MNQMFNILKEEITWGNQKLTLETGKIARQADGSVVVSYGDTVVLCTAVWEKSAKEDIDFLPLTVHYQEKAFAVGKIPGGFFKREGKPSEKEVLVSRLIDRPIRPLFPEEFYNEVQVVCTVLSHDGENDSDVIAIIGASAALAISGVPFLGPIAATKVCYIDGSYVLNPTIEQIKNSELDLVVSGTKEGVLMVESEAKELSEDVMLGAVNFGHESYQAVINMIQNLQKKVSKQVSYTENTDSSYKKCLDQVKKISKEDLEKAYKNKIKQERYAALDAVKTNLLEHLKENEFSQKTILSCFEKLKADVLRGNVINHKTRVDGRGLEDIRPISCEVGILPRAHGSALFTRGETQALVALTLGTGHDEQIVDALEGEYKEGFMLHYNFPPYSVGEVGRMLSPGRREIGHGKLAWRSIKPLLPSKNNFPYTLRIVSEITESNGSSSMATVCASSLSLMDAAVPIKKPIAGIAMGLVKEGKDFAVLSDILGDEDHLGDMDFKVAGTQDGITALQMDLKITSITPNIMEIALKQAKTGRLHIIKEMLKAIEKPRDAMSKFAPQIVNIKISKDKIRDVIGSGGKVIREICETTGVKIDIDDEGNVSVSCNNKDSIEKAISIIEGIVMEPEVGKIYHGKVTRILEFGAIVQISGNKDGMVHVSEIAHQRVEKVSDVLKIGDEVAVKLIGIDGNRLKLSIKAAIKKD